MAQQTVVQAVVSQATFQDALAVLAGAAAYVDGLYELQEFADCAPL